MMADTRSFSAAVALCFAMIMPHSVFSQQSDGYTLQGRIFDFSASHPDFERSETGLVTGQVQAQLGADGRMVWSGQSSPVFSSNADFDQWYRDVPGLNASRPIDITLERNPDSGLYVYENSRFFPIDGELLGNEDDQYQDTDGQPRNFHFTTHLAAVFSFQSDSDQFSFTGDDDLWVFFDGKLGIDLGGTHPPASAAINGAGLMQLGLEPGRTYRLDVFHAERHTNGSTFRIETNFDISPPASRELPSEPGDSFDDAGNKIVAMTPRATCDAATTSPAAMLADDASGTRFLAAYCLTRPEISAIIIGTGESLADAKLDGLSNCLVAEGEVADGGGASGCVYYGMAERVVSTAPQAVVSPGQSLLHAKRYLSKSGAHYLITGDSSDLRIVETDTNAVVWSLRLVDRLADYIHMTDRGTLAMLDLQGAVIWETPIAAPVPGSALEIDDTGVAFIQSPSGEVLWRSDLLPEQPNPGLSYEISLRKSDRAVTESEDGGSTSVSTTSLVTHIVSYLPPETVPMAEVEVVLPPESEMIAVEINDDDAGTPALADLPDISVLLTYSINDQVRDAANQGPDYYVAVDGAAEGVIVEGEGLPLLVLRDGDRVVFQAADGDFKDMVLIAEDDRAVFGQFSDAAFFLIRPPLEPTEGNFASFESEAYPGQFLRHQGFRLKLDEAGPDAPSLLRRDATFRIEAARDTAAQTNDAGDETLSCADALQGRIAWDYAGNTNWSERNLAKICGNVTSAEPARCFAQVMHGGVEWAPGKLEWNWNSASALCGATTDAAARITCFQERMPQEGRDEAIAACREVAMGGQ